MGPRQEEYSIWFDSRAQHFVHGPIERKTLVAL